MTRLFARWALDQAGAEALLKAHDPGIAVAALIPMRGGMSTSNYAAVTNRGKVLLKIYRDADGGIEPRMYAQLGELTPRLMFADRSCAIIPRAYAAIAFIEGETLLEHIERLGAFPLPLAERLGAMLARVHARKYDREGLLDLNLEISSPIPGARERTRDLAQQAAGARLSPKTRDALLALCEDRPDLFARLDADCVLCHGDMGFGNILVSGDRAYFIDLEYALAGSRYRDTGHFFRRKDEPVQACLTNAVFEAFAGGYGGLPADWRALSRLADVPAMLALINGSDVPAAWIGDIERDVRDTIELLSGTE